jgi:Tol biopolymer transport system component
VLQLYVRDRLSGRTLLASSTAGGQPASAPVDDSPDQRAYAISGDGRYVVFASGAANLAPDESDGAARDVFRKDLLNGALAVVSRAADGSPANASVAGDPDISYDGSRIVYETGAATNLWPEDGSAAPDVVLADLTAQRNELVSVTSAGAPLTGVLRRAAISADGTVVAFESDTGVTVRDLEARTTTAIPSAARPDLSGDGGVVVYESGAGVGRRVLDSAAETAAETAVLSSAGSPSVSADGTRVVVESTTPHVVSDTNGAPDVYAWNLGGAVERASQRADGSGAVSASTRPAMSGNGALVAFDFDDGASVSPLAAEDANGAEDVLGATLAPTDAAGPDITVSDATATGGGSVIVTGSAADPSGVVSLTVGGYVARRTGGAFAVEVPLVSAAPNVVVRATDGAGNVTERAVPAVRFRGPSPMHPLKARARSLTVRQVGRATIARFRLDSGATRVTVRLWRRVPRIGRAPSWTPAGQLRSVRTTAGRRTALVHNRRLRPDVYQVRVTVVSRGGVAVASARHLVPRSAPAR